MATEDTKPDAKKSETEEKKRQLKESEVRTQHTVTIEGQEISYAATAGTLLLKDQTDDPKASVFYVAYTRNGIDDVSQRPLTFSFNGGPGSSSVWLHMGVVGPRRVLMDDEGNPLPPPCRLVNNEYSLLDLTDLVFIDPVSTGYSRPAPGEEAKKFHGVKQDVESVAEFIRLYATRNKRWASPKFLIGESYGTTRAAGLSGYLQDELGMYLNGIMLISAVLNFQSIRFDLGNDLPYVLFLPTYAAAAWYHRRLSAELLKLSLTDFLAQVSAFAMGDYAQALMQGDSYGGTARAGLVRTLAGYTGLSEAYVEQTNLRINIHRFVKELLRSERRTIGRFDARIKGIDRDAAGEYHDYDPSYSIVLGAYTAALNDYLRSTLNYKSDLPYEILTGNVQPWDYSPYQNSYVNVAETLRQAMTGNPYLKIFVGNGYYDLATPFLATEYTFSHLGLDPTLQSNVSMGYYEAGHMMYLHKASLEKLRADLAGFLRAVLKG